MEVKNFDIIVVGGGLVGLVFALDLARKKPKFQIAIIDAKAPIILDDNVLDSRVYAISPHNVNYLENISAWPIDQSRIGTIDKMDVYGDAGGNIVFNKLDNNQFYLAKTIESNLLQKNILFAISDLDNVSFIYDELQKIEYIAENKIKLIGANGQYISYLIVGADGTNSFVRNQLDFTLNQIDYMSHGIVANFTCEKPHNNTARQWFNAGSILAYLPLPQNKISIVWANNHYKEIMGMDQTIFEGLVAKVGNHTLGGLKLITQCESFPLKMNLLEKTFTKNIVLIGDAAHTIHPLAGQGVNLGFCDAKNLDDTLCSVEKYHIADTTTLSTYDKKRLIAVKKIQLTCHSLNRLFAIDNQVIKHIRNFGLNMVNNVPFIKRFLASNV